MYSTVHRTHWDRLRRRRHRRRHRPTNRLARFLAPLPLPSATSAGLSVGLFQPSLFLFPLLTFRLYLAGEAALLPVSLSLPLCMFSAHPSRPSYATLDPSRARGVASSAGARPGAATYSVGRWDSGRSVPRHENEMPRVNLSLFYC